MANLIITVIAIALVAVAALIGAFYGGSSFLEGSAKAQASTIASQAQQVAAAWVLYANDHGNNYDSAVNSYSLTAALVPTYLMELPRPPSAATLSGNYSAANLTNAAASNNYNGVYLPLLYNSFSMDVCRKIAQAAAGSTAQPTQRPSNNLNPGTGRRFDCVYLDEPPVGMDVNDPKTIVYKVR